MTGSTECDPSFERVAQFTMAGVFCLRADPEAREAGNAADDAAIFDVFIGGQAHGRFGVGIMHGGSP